MKAERVSSLLSIQAPSETELISYGITSKFIEFIRSLNYNTFRDFSAGKDQGPTDAPASGEDAPDAPSLNAWQVRHAMLVVRAVKEVNELRYVLCPRYMQDQKFWEIYFALAASHLPAVASTWKEGDSLPLIAGTSQGDEDSFMSVTGLQGHLKTIGTKIQAAATAATKGKVGGGGVELSSLLPLGGTSSGSAAADSADGSGIKVTSEEAKNSAHGGALLETDPDLEAYLQTADEEREGNYKYNLDASEGGGGGGSGSGGGGTSNELDEQLCLREDRGDNAEDDDLDLDRYLNELSAEVGDAEGGEEGEKDGDSSGDGAGDHGDVEAALRELQDEI